MAHDDRATVAAKEACKRALEGMIGSVDFAFVCLCHYERVQSRELLAALVALLPKGACIVGGVGRGLFGVDAQGQASEIDPALATPSVSVMLGRVPGMSARALHCNKHPTNIEDFRTLAALGSSEKPQLFVVMGKPYDEGFLFEAPHMLNKEYDEALVVGGVASPGAGSLFCRDPGNPDKLLCPRSLALALCKCTEQDAVGKGCSTCKVDATTVQQGSPSSCQPFLAAHALGVRGVGPMEGSSYWHNLEITNYGSDDVLEGASVSCLVEITAAHGPAGQSLVEMREEFDVLKKRNLMYPVQLAMCAGNIEEDSPHTIDFVGSDPTGVPVVYLAEYTELDPTRVFAEVEGALEVDDKQKKGFTGKHVTISRETNEAILRAHVPHLADSKGAHPNPELYAALSASAEHHGARSSRQGMFAFSCFLRGQTLYGEIGKESAIIDEVLQTPVSISGMFCGGEIGPAISNGTFAFAHSGPKDTAHPSAPLSLLNYQSEWILVECCSNVLALLF
eukprot:evm.model.scf_362EXC.12 EVM.evm.TU.scf_362EXC.12   scf_362EXC:67101-73600(-)